MPNHLFPRGTWDPMFVEYETIHQYGYTLTRPILLEGTVGGAAVPPLPAAVKPIALYSNANGALAPGGAAEDLPLGFDRGHIMARALGGVNTHYNLVPMPAQLNNGDWATFERRIRDSWNVHKFSGNRIYYRVRLTYSLLGEPTLPSAMEGWAYLRPRVHPFTVAGRAAAINTAPLPSQVAHSGPHNLDARGLDPFVFSPAQNAALTAIGTAYAAWGAQPTVGGGNNLRGDPPAGGALGPYAALDVVDDPAQGVLRGNLNAAFPTLDYPAGGAVKSVTLPRYFSQPQKRLLRLYNRWLNNGRLTSDNAWYDHNCRLAHSRAQIDHIVPYTHVPTSNFYWNAQVTSRIYNGTVKGNRTEAAAQAHWSAQPARQGPARRRHRTQHYHPYAR